MLSASVQRRHCAITTSVLKVVAEGDFRYPCMYVLVTKPRPNSKVRPSSSRHRVLRSSPASHACCGYPLSPEFCRAFRASRANSCLLLFGHSRFTSGGSTHHRRFNGWLLAIRRWLFHGYVIFCSIPLRNRAAVLIVMNRQDGGISGSSLSPSAVRRCANCRCLRCTRA